MAITSSLLTRAIALDAKTRKLQPPMKKTDVMVSRWSTTTDLITTSNHTFHNIKSPPVTFSVRPWWERFLERLP
jgi:hypothetical protein